MRCFRAYAPFQVHDSYARIPVEQLKVVRNGAHCVSLSSQYLTAIVLFQLAVFLGDIKINLE